jgi:hypothetical protein
MVALETDSKFTRPGMVLLVTGIVAILLRGVIRGLPLLGGLLAWVFLLSGIFFIVGGIFLLIKKRG